MRICLRRREFIAGLGGAAALWPLTARAQQRALPVIGYLSGRTADSDASLLVSLRRGLADVGYAEGRNVAIEYRFGDGRYDRLSAQLTDLTQRKVGVIVLVGSGATERVLQQVRASPIPISVARCARGLRWMHFLISVLPCFKYDASQSP